MNPHADMARIATKQQDTVKTRIAAESTASEIADLREDVKKLESIKTEIGRLREEFKDAQMSKRYYYWALGVALLSLVVGIAALFK